jgi:hypothetical protein
MRRGAAEAPTVRLLHPQTSPSRQHWERVIELLMAGYHPREIRLQLQMTPRRFSYVMSSLYRHWGIDSSGNSPFLPYVRLVYLVSQKLRPRTL